MIGYLKKLLKSGPSERALTTGLRLSEDDGLVAVPVQDGRMSMRQPRLDDPERV